MIRLLPLLGLLLLGVSCNVTQKIKDGDTAFERKQYALAVTFLEKEFESSRLNENRSYKAFLLGQSYDRMNAPASAIRWYREAYEAGYGPEALIEYARVLREDQQYGNAIKAYDILIERYGNSPEFVRARNNCILAREWIEQQGQTGYRVTKADFNSPASDYAPVYYKDGSIVFSSDRSNATGGDTYQWTGRSYSDFFKAFPGTNEVVSFDNRFNTKHNEGTLAFSPDYEEVYFTRCIDEQGGDDYCQIYYSRREGALWTVPRVMPFVEPSVNYGHPTVMMNGDALIYSAKQEGGIGGYDLYMVYRRGADWLEPFPLPADEINTIGNEMFPTVYKDTLYFSSDQHVGMGGLDIFKTYLLTPDLWAPIENLRAPINSGGDDFGYTVDPFYKGNSQTVVRGVFTSSREEANGGDDIYYFAKEVVAPIEREEESEEFVVKVIGTVSQQLYQDPNDPDSRKTGIRPIPNNTVRINSTGLFDFLETDEEGKFEYELSIGQLYEFSAARDSLLATSGRISTVDLSEPITEDVTYVLDLVLDRIFYNKEVILENIYYDFNKWDIRPDAEPTLDELAELLNDNPTIRIELGSHTDCRGTDAYNITLSQRRAQSVVDYLIGSGIDANRLRAIGYGETKLRNTCVCEECSEEAHQENRRTTFKIVE